MLKTLVKKQMQEIFRSYFYDEKKNKKRSTASTVMYILLYVLIMVGVLGGMFTFLSVAICGAFTAAGMGWLYFALMGLLAILLGTFGSVFIPMRVYICQRIMICCSPCRSRCGIS